MMYLQSIPAKLIYSFCLALFSLTVVHAAPDTTPDAFSFSGVSDAELSTSYTSNTITVTGISTGTSMSISGGQYSLNSGVLTNNTGTVVSGDQVAITHSSANTFNTLVSSILDIGGVIGTFTITTKIEPEDMLPDTFSFASIQDVSMGQTFYSNTVDISGINTGVTVSIIGDGSYTLDGSNYTTGETFVPYSTSGFQVTLQMQSSPNKNSFTSSTLTVGSGSAVFTIKTSSFGGRSSSIKGAQVKYRDSCPDGDKSRNHYDGICHAPGTTPIDDDNDTTTQSLYITDGILAGRDVPFVLTNLEENKEGRVYTLYTPQLSKLSDAKSMQLVENFFLKILTDNKLDNKTTEYILELYEQLTSHIYAYLELNDNEGMYGVKDMRIQLMAMFALIQK